MTSPHYPGCLSCHDSAQSDREVTVLITDVIKCAVMSFLFIYVYFLFFIRDVSRRLQRHRSLRWRRWLWAGCCRVFTTWVKQNVWRVSTSVPISGILMPRVPPHALPLLLSGAVRASSLFPILSVGLLFLGGVCVAASEFYKSRYNVILSAGILFVSAGQKQAQIECACTQTTVFIIPLNINSGGGRIQILYWGKSTKHHCKNTEMENGA